MQKQKRSNNNTPQNDKQQAASLFGVKAKEVEPFEMIDPFNKNNNVSGFINQKDGAEGGSIVITHINQTKLKQLQFIHGTPKLHYPYSNYDTYDWKDFQPKNAKEEDKLDKVVVSNKWNGTNILFFIYSDDQGNIYLSAKTKGRAFLSNNRHVDLYDLTIEALGINSERTGNFMEWEDVWSKFVFLDYWVKKIKEKANDWQSISCELCGQGEPHLVKYDFHLRLCPLFVQKSDGSIHPIQNFAKDMNNEELCNDCLIESVIDVKDLHTKLSNIQQSDLERNEQYRKENNLQQRYEYNRFITEGRVLYPLNKEGRLLNRYSMYKIKPKDIEDVHWATFDRDIKGRVDEAVRKCCERDKAITIENIRSELDMQEKEWSKFGQKVTYYVECVLKPAELTNSPPDHRCVFILTGLPCSGKTTFATKFKQAFDSQKSEADTQKHINDPTNHCLEIISQDNSQTPDWKRCLERVSVVLQRRNSVIFDHENGTKSERTQIINKAHGDGVQSDHIFIIHIATDQTQSNNRYNQLPKTKKQRTPFETSVKQYNTPNHFEYTEAVLTVTEDINQEDLINNKLIPFMNGMKLVLDENNNNENKRQRENEENEDQSNKKQKVQEN
jgi:tRNA uridine 5-carbamoylmethylation protein Kti12